MVTANKTRYCNVVNTFFFQLGDAALVRYSAAGSQVNAAAG